MSHHSPGLIVNSRTFVGIVSIISHLLCWLSCQWRNFLPCIFPLKTKTVCTVKTAKRVTIVAAVVFVAFDSQFFFIIRKHEKNYCEFIKVSESYIMIFNRIDAVLYSFAPFAIIVLLNIAIIYKFVKAKLETARAGITESTNQALSKSPMRGTAILITVSVTFICQQVLLI